MHIGVISPEFPPAIGGVESYAYGYCKALAELGHAVTVFTTPQNAAAVVPGATIVPKLSIVLPKDTAILRAHPVDAWHAMNAAYAWVAEMGEAPAVVSVHGNDFLRPYLRMIRPNLKRYIPASRFRKRMRPFEIRLGAWLTRRNMIAALPKAAQIFANSRYTAEVLLKLVPACAGKTTVAHVGIGDEWLASPLPVREPGAGNRLLTVARLSAPRKNVDLVIRALAELRDDFPFTYTIVGDGHLRPELERLRDRLGLQDRVVFRGFLTAQALRATVAASDLFVLTSSILPGSHEGFGIVYLEANACGTPVLAARLAGAVDAVEDGVSGLFVDAISVPALSSTLRRFLSGQIRFEPAACRRFAEQFRWRNIVETVLPYYRRER